MDRTNTEVLAQMIREQEFIVEALKLQNDRRFSNVSIHSDPGEIMMADLSTQHISKQLSDALSLLSALKQLLRKYKLVN